MKIWLMALFIYILFYLCASIYVSLCMSDVYWCLWMPGKGSRAPEPVVTRGCELPDIGAGN